MIDLNVSGERVRKIKLLRHENYIEKKKFANKVLPAVNEKCVDSEYQLLKMNNWKRQ